MKSDFYPYDYAQLYRVDVRKMMQDNAGRSDWCKRNQNIKYGSRGIKLAGYSNLPNITAKKKKYLGVRDKDLVRSWCPSVTEFYKNRDPTIDYSRSSLPVQLSGKQKYLQDLNAKIVKTQGGQLQRQDREKSFERLKHVIDHQSAKRKKNFREDWAHGKYSKF
eukprot:CAMPEP_0174267064 /NCGR_PEP_ID=MMETSP0439-20130205/32322_1 /TAXON_ID=0 /ORGANISM="Stereomyxa ramosa, Strain Chinc5" /LENGTH=162 /DNA_ID=CAMNT_0015354367 /DNA_START=1 /DNA_END=489 /DNA_ORIENTATION=-